MNPRDSPRSRSKGRWSQRRPLVAVLLAVDTSLLTSTPAERLATGYPAPIPAQRLATSDPPPIPAQRLATSDPPPIPAQRLATSGIQLVSSDTAGIGHQSLVSTTINSTSVASRHTPWVTPGRQPGARHQRSTADTSGKARHQRSTADTCGKAAPLTGDSTIESVQRFATSTSFGRAVAWRLASSLSRSSVGLPASAVNANTYQSGFAGRFIA